MSDQHVLFAMAEESITPRFRPLDDPDHGWQGRRHLSRGRRKEVPMGRILLAGIVGGIVVFVWGALSHMVLPVGEMGIRVLPDEEAVVSTLRTTIREPGLYLYPGMDMTREPTEAEQKAWEARYKAGPRGMLVYQPGGDQPLSPRQFGTELLADIVAALIAAWLLSRAVEPYLRRVVFVTFLGFFAWLVTSVSYWNWYGFPTEFVLAEAVDSIVSWLLAGLVLAKIVKPDRA
jgi:hypothetical protein